LVKIRIQLAISLTSNYFFVDFIFSAKLKLRFDNNVRLKNWICFRFSTMIKNLIGIFIIILSFSFLGKNETIKLANADQYKVIKVDGQIIFRKTKIPMKQGDVFISGTPIEFSTPQSRAAVISSAKGRFVISASDNGEAKVLPATNNVSSRAGSITNWVGLQMQFSGRVLILGEMRLKLFGESLQMTDSTFFFLTYVHNDENIIKKIPYDNQFLILNKEEIFKIDGQPIEVSEKQMTLYRSESGKAFRMGEFTPVFPDLEILKTEITILLLECAEMSDGTKRNEVKGYLNDFYAKPETDNVNNWLTSEFNLQ